MKRHLLTLFILSISFSLFSQTADRKWGLGIKGGSQQYNGDIGNGFYDINQAFYAFGGVTISRYLSQHLDLNASLTTGSLGHFDSSRRRFSTKVTQYSASLKYNIFKTTTPRTLNPFVSAGIGYMKFKERKIRNDFPVGNYHATKSDYNNMMLPSASIGLTVSLSPSVHVVLEETYIRSDYDAIDNHVNNAKDVYLQHSLGLVFNIGKSKDTDKDGVADKRDECPNTFGLKTLNGCPDSDGDGVTDKKDECPKEKGLKNLKGCPDSDGDGIADNKDACPNKKGSKNLKGCPDSDGDGVADNKDECPNEKGLKNLKGCPDSDGDGVPDKDDQCPKVKGTKNANGCPEKVKDKIESVLPVKKLYTVYFESGNSTINKTSKAVLVAVAQALKKSPKSTLEIKGYTDSDGDDKINLSLSKQRAKMVEKFLVNNGLSKKRISTQGYGAKSPVDSNSSESGKSKNRRVELHIK